MYICVFAGAKVGNRPVYRQAAQALGRELAARGIGLVYGGASVGLMGALADEMLRVGGKVTGVVPERAGWSSTENHRGLTLLCEVEGMHERKAKMAELADGFLALPGGFGTFDELFEVITWAQLGLHRKPIGVLNVNGFFAHWRSLIEHAIDEGFIRLEHSSFLKIPGEDLFFTESEVSTLVARLQERVGVRSSLCS